MTWTVPGYRIESLLGRGGFGDVWAAVQVSTGQRVALKRIDTADARAVASARAEAALIAALDHPNLIRLHEFVALDGAVVLALELAAGGTLAAVLGRRDRLSPAEVSAALSPIASALAHAHGKGVVHGDVSASNVLFADSGHAKLADLGLARIFGSGTDALGTLAYLDPVIASGGVGGSASDVFSLAAVCLHALTGRGPWHAAGSDVHDLMARAGSGVIAHLAELDLVCPPAMSTALKRALDHDPGRRGTATDLALDLRAAVVPKPVALTAGRVPGARHRAPESTGAPAARPDFARPRPPVSDRVAVNLTRIARPQVRTPVAPQAAGGRVPNPSTRTRRAIALAAVGVATIGLGTATAAVVLGRDDARRPVAVTSPARPPAEDVADVSAILNGLDLQRSSAYARRDPALVRSIYRSPTLGDQDARQLVARVPVGCGLFGLRTTYAKVTVITRSATRVEVHAAASLSRATLRCGSSQRRRTEAVPPTPVRLVLTRSAGGGFAIESQRVG